MNVTVVTLDFPVLPRVQRAILLAELAWLEAGSLLDMTGDEIAGVVRAYSPIADDAERWDAWSEFAARVVVERGVIEGTVTWSEVTDDPAWPSASEDALETAERRSVEALEVLLAGAAS